MQADIAPRHKGPLALPPGNGHVHHVHGDSAPTDAVKNRRRGKDQLHAGDDNDVFLVELLSADHPSVIHHNPIGTAIVHDKIPGGFPDNPPMNLGNTHVGESTMSQASARPRVIPGRPVRGNVNHRLSDSWKKNTNNTPSAMVSIPSSIRMKSPSPMGFDTISRLL